MAWHSLPCLQCNKYFVLQLNPGQDGVRGAGAFQPWRGLTAHELSFSAVSSDSCIMLSDMHERKLVAHCNGSFQSIRLGQG